MLPRVDRRHALLALLFLIILLSLVFIFSLLSLFRLIDLASQPYSFMLHRSFNCIVAALAVLARSLQPPLKSILNSSLF